MPEVKHQKILMVEDDVDLAEMLKAALQSKGYSVHTAVSGEQALADLEEHPVDLVLLDFILAGQMDGQEVLTKLKANPATASIPVIIVSGFLDHQRIQGLLATGASLHLTKPYYPNVLLQMVANLLAARDKQVGQS